MEVGQGPDEGCSANEKNILRKVISFAAVDLYLQ
jgi:hypothetical protein